MKKDFFIAGAFTSYAVYKGHSIPISLVAGIITTLK